MNMDVSNSWCTLKVDNDGMHALFCLQVPEGEEEFTITEQVINDFLKQQNIIFGISSIAIQVLLNDTMYGQYVCVAMGKPATHGVDGHFEFAKDMQDMKKKPLIAEDGTADYKNSLNLATIKEGELLAEYIPATDGTSGVDIFGNDIPSLGKGKDLLPLRGRGIVSDEEKKKFYAEYSGHIVMEDTKIYIDKLYRVSGNLDIEVGNIVFDGDVEVMGDVRSGFSIDTTGSIFIHGHVGGCTLNAGGNITIEKGIQGRDICIITAKGDVACKFIERCKIYADGNIYADSVLNANLIAKNRVIVTSKSGNVIGSEVYGMTGVIVKEAGNCAGTHTLLRSGLPREEYAKAHELFLQINEIEEKINSFNHHLEVLEVSDKDDETKDGMRKKIMRAKIVLSSQKSKCMEELNVLNGRIVEDAHNSFVDVLDLVYEGVRIYIGNVPYIVTEQIREVSYYRNNTAIVCCPLINRE